MLRTTDLTGRYGKTMALKSWSLLGRCEPDALLRPTGVSASMLLQMLNGLFAAGDGGSKWRVIA